MPMESVWADILKDFQEREIRVHSEKDLWKEIESSFVALTTKEDYVKNLISGIPLKLQNVQLNNGELVWWKISDWRTVIFCIEQQ